MIYIDKIFFSKFLPYMKRFLSETSYFLSRYFFNKNCVKQNIFSEIFSIAVFSFMLAAVVLSLALVIKIKPYLHGILSQTEKPIEIGDFKREEDRAITIRDRSGKMLATLYPEYGGKHISVKYQEIPAFVIDAVISAEDKNFFSHNGVDFEAILRAFIINVKERRIVSGGSTITQQLIKNVHPRKRTYKNKLIEATEAIRLEKVLSKEDIITLYLNRIFFGNNLYGIAAAADAYFKKSLNELDVSEAAMLAAIIKSGTMFNPYKYPEKTEERRKYVLEQMFENKYITKSQYKKAYAYTLAVQKDKNIFLARHFSMYVLDAIKKLKVKDIVNVRTTLDYNIQTNTEAIIKNTTQSLESFNVRNVSCVILDAKTGAILSMVGSLDYNDAESYGAVNGTTSFRQPGSSLKPFLYAYIFEKGENPASVIGDIETFIPTFGGDYAPVNYSKKYYGPVRVRTSLANSLNVSTVRWLERYNVGEYQRLLMKAGLTSINRNPDHYGMTLALGSAEVSLLDLATAYTIFPNEGILINNYSVSEIKKSDGSVFTPKKKGRKNVISKESAYLVTHILSDYNARLMAFPGLRGIVYPFSIALKTGTSKDFRDAWVVGYTKDYIVGIWMGDFGGSSMHNITGGNSAVPVMYDIFLMLNETQKQTVWNKPETIVKEYICPLSGKYPTENCPSKIEEVFDVKNLPKGYCGMHKLYTRTVSDMTEKQVFVLFPKEYDKWVKDQGIKTPSKEWTLENTLIPAQKNLNALTAYNLQNIEEGESPVDFISKDGAPDSEVYAKDRSPVILYPKNNSIYSIDGVLPIEYQRIELRASIPEGVKEYIWYCDDAEYARKSKDDESKVKWQIKSGSHFFKLVAIMEDESILESMNVSIFVK